MTSSVTTAARIEPATADDLKEVCRVHFLCFPNSFSTHLGKARHRGTFLLSRYYEEFFRDHPELFFVAKGETGAVVGFCMGYLCEKTDYGKRFFKRNAPRIGLRVARLTVTGNRVTWKKIRAFFRKSVPFETRDTSFDRYPSDARSSLLSICVLPEMRGTGTASALVEAYLDALKKIGREVCLLTVEEENGRGIRFYEKQGYVLYREAKGCKRQYAKLVE